ncbi:SCO2524 family protein [Nocardia sp. NPDC004068]|uniref:SCO2524 family protein n=1 Tax=Nocardia sp. NPDC004068 TaxID=3364303 RepID=UPI00368CC136
MRIQPRQQILGIWRALLTSRCSGGEWTWGGCDGSNSISDAEQLLCLLYPATEIEALALDDPDTVQDDVFATLAPFFGRARDISPKIVEILEDYLDRYTGPTGQPVFSAGGYLRSSEARAATARQLELDVVESYSKSLTLCIAGLKYLRSFARNTGSRSPVSPSVSSRIETLQARLDHRLTTAMVGLIRSFVVHTVEPESAAGRAMLTMFNQTHVPTNVVVNGVAKRLERLRMRLCQNLTLSETAEEDLREPGVLFECGWSWGIARRAERVEFVSSDMEIAKVDGLAIDHPSLYFTVVALDCINNLADPYTRESLNAEQRRLYDALRLRWELAQSYWSAMARYGDGRWPLEDIPWRTSDGEESDYFSLSVSAVLIQDLFNREASDEHLTRAAPIFDELARRGRITRRVTTDDPARQLHVPGVRLLLKGTEDLDGGPVLQWLVSDYEPVLLERTLQAARLSSDLVTRDRLLDLAQATMEHLESRAYRSGPEAGLWDDVERVFATDTTSFDCPGRQMPAPRPQSPSWSLTERVIECLVVADAIFRQPPLPSAASAMRALELLTEAEHLLNQRLLELSERDLSPNRQSLEQIGLEVARARSVINERPGTAHSICAEALRRLDKLEFAGNDAARGV